jgi:Cu(I)/Ag(I) efflux system membrane fusion protein
MKPLLKGVLTAAAVIAAAGAGLWAGQTGIGRLPGHVATPMTERAKPEPEGPVIYYRDPSGKPLYSLTPKSTADGKAYVAVYASEDIAFDAPKAASEAPKQPAQADAQGRKIIHYRNPMGLPDISPVPKKDSMGMDYIPVYADEVDDANIVKVSPGKIQRSGVKTGWWVRDRSPATSAPQVSSKLMSGALASSLRGLTATSKRSAPSPVAPTS